LVIESDGEQNIQIGSPQDIMLYWRNEL